MQLYLYLLLIPTRLDEYNTYLMRGTKVQATEFILLRDWVICELWSCELQLRVGVASCELRVASCELQLRVASCELPKPENENF